MHEREQVTLNAKFSVISSFFREFIWLLSLIVLVLIFKNLVYLRKKIVTPLALIRA